MSARSTLRAWSGAALLALAAAGCADPSRSVGPDERADAAPPVAPTAVSFRMVGGGRIDDQRALLLNAFREPGVCRGKSFATFSLDAGPSRTGALSGTLTWVDHCRGFTIEGTGVTAYLPISGTGANRSRGCAEWEGPASLNGVPGFRFKIEPACDEGEPGWRQGGDPTDLADWIAVELIADNGTVIYIRHGKLTGGNLQTVQSR